MTYTLKTKTRTIKTKKRQLGGISNPNVPPTLKDNLKKSLYIIVQLFNNMTMYTLDKVEDKIENVTKSYGIDPNKSLGDEFTKLGKKAEQINEVLSSPEGKRVLVNINDLFNRITKNVIVPNSKKLTEELIKNLHPIMVRGQNAVFALLSASPFGAIIDIPRFLSESLGVVEKSVSLADDVLDIGIDTVDEVKMEKGNFDNILSEINSLSKSANSQISNGLDNVKNTVDMYGKNINNIEQMNNGAFKKYQNEAKMIGGRIQQSQTNFLSPYINKDKILKQYGGKLNTKRRIYVKRRLTSRNYK